ncbi:MAG: hypothetical protein ACE5IB_02420 [Candidatus Geothermarchaeales archaeon]
MTRTDSAPYLIRVKIGDREIEIGGTKEDVLATFEEQLPAIVEKTITAFVGAEQGRAEGIEEAEMVEGRLKAEYPSIPPVKSCSEGVVELFKTKWGMRPRTIGDIREALRANEVLYPVTTISGVLVNLTRHGKIRRWKTASGYVYVLR